ncbi:MAG: Hpt domain-containing protein [Candidatus Hydrogenedentes bacterium]|nr:Hpt domain-containing protein [Candidatus Hydrogenedentota bacterium]
MDNSKLLARIEVLSEALLLADASDIDIFAKAHDEFLELAAWADRCNLTAPASALRGACELIERLVLGEVPEPAAAADTIIQCLSAIQHVARDGCSASDARFPAELLGAGAQQTGADPATRGKSQTTGTVSDRSLLPEFISHAKNTLSEIEPLIVQAERHPASRIVSQVRRAIHTLQAEAAFVGLNQMSAALRATEDAIDRAGGDQLPGGILDAIEWVRRSIAACEGKGDDAGSPEPFLTRFGTEPIETHDGELQTQARVEHPSETDPDLLREFVAEAREHLDNADIHLLNVETDPRDSDAINAVFRAFHTIKGVAGFLALEQIQSLSHEAENLLDKARKGELDLQGNYIDLTFDAVDMMKRLVANVDCALSSGAVLASEDGVGALVARLHAAVTGHPALQSGDAIAAKGQRKRVGEILESAGNATRSTVESALAAQVRAEAPPLGELLVREIVISRAQLNQALEIQKREGYTRRLGEILVASGMARTDDIYRAIGKQHNAAPEPIGATLVRAGDVSAKVVARALRGQRQQQPVVDVREPVKVDAERLDKLVDLIGELVIAESMVSQSTELSKVTSQQLARRVNQLDKITRELQEIGTSLRMVPVRATFHKMSRLVRDLAKKSGKFVEFVTEGEDTELDKTVVDKIGDPLVHMVRNAVDHGLEATPEERVGVGKTETGHVTLRAFHKGGSIYIEVEDDGRGLDREVILAKGRERGLVRDGDALSDREVFGLIFEPGFSTAKQITDVSGRGVGMDVVRRNVESLRGQIDIQSTPGVGSKFSIRLPLTLAIIDGMVIRVGRERYIVPTLSVHRSIKPNPEHLNTVVDRVEMLTLQGRHIPLFRLHRLFEIEGAETDPLNALVLILEDEGRQVGLMIDELLGQRQIVIKSLGDAMKGIDGIAGGAIMGDGTVGLIVDVGGVVRMAQNGAGALGMQACGSAA